MKHAPTATILAGNCIDRLRELDDCSIHGIVTEAVGR